MPRLQNVVVKSFDFHGPDDHGADQFVFKSNSNPESSGAEQVEWTYATGNDGSTQNQEDFQLNYEEIKWTYNTKESEFDDFFM